MKQRTFALFAALTITAITATSCSSDSKSADSFQAPATTIVSGASIAGATAEMTTEAAADIAAQDSMAVPASTVVLPDQQGGVPMSNPMSNPVTDPAEDAVSTFAMDVDTGSYTYARGSLQSGVVPDPNSVRTEEFVNARDQDYESPDDSAFALTIDATTAPFLPGDTRVVRVGIQGKSIADENRADANLTFVVDISGSMSDPGKLDAVRPALQSLVESLRSTDRVGIVVYSDDTRVLLPSTPIGDRQTIADAIAQLQPEGATNVEQGLQLGYEQARESLDPDRIDRVILLSDGVANVGATGPDAILGVIGDAARDGIDLVTVGFGLGDYNDTLMEQLADRGDGFYAYVDGEREAVRLFGEDLTGTLQTIAREAKVQVEFNTATISSYRLIGFENRAVADEDFRNDAVDGGEVGSGHTVTALYEVTVHEGASADDAWLARGVIRWLDPDTSVPSELETSLLATDVAGTIGDSPLRLQQDVYVAAFAETLRGSGWTGLISLDGLSQNLHSLATRLGDPDLTETADLIDTRIALG